MAVRNFLPAKVASCSRCCSRSSRNFKNMIQVSIGNRSRSPLSPLSLRMMSRADLIRLPSDCVVVGGADGFAGDLRGIERPLELSYGVTKVLGPTEQADDVCDLAM